MGLSTWLMQRAHVAALRGHFTLSSLILSAAALKGNASIGGTVSKLCTNGDITAAQDLCLRMIRRGNKRLRRQAIDFLWRTTLWLKRDGFLDAAEGPWRALGPNRSKIAREKLVRLWWKSGAFTSDHAKHVKEFLHCGLAPEIALLGFRIIEITHNFDEEARGLLLRYLKDVRNKNSASERTFKAGAAAILAANGSDANAVAMLLKDHTLQDAVAKSTSLSAYLTDRGWPSTTNIKDAAAVHRLIASGTAAIWDLLADPTKTVAVVGNSPCEKGLGKGAEIDAFDLVIRFNSGGVPDEHQKDYGAKTNIAVCNLATFPNALVSKTALSGMLITGIQLDRQNPDIPALLELTNHGFPVGTVPEQTLNELIRTLGSPPSSGLQVAATLARLRKGKRTGFFGFAFTDQVGPAATSANFAKHTRPSFRHNWQGERMVFDLIMQGMSTGESLLLPAAPRQQQLLTDYRPLKLHFAGDHSRYHCGSAAVSRYIVRKLEEQGLLVDDEDYDILVVNGEGSMHHNSSAFIGKMEMLEKALEAGKRALLVNTLWQSNSNRFDHVLKSLDQIIVRERLSQTELLEKHGVSSTLIPDFSYFAPVKQVAIPNAPKDKVLVTDFFSNDFQTFAAVTGGRLSRLPFIDMKKLTWDEMIATLRQNRLLITGRHHAVYAACRAEIPFVVMGGNSHKIQGIFASAGVAIPTISNLGEVDGAVQWAENNASAYNDLFKWMRSQKDWRVNISP